VILMLIGSINYNLSLGYVLTFLLAAWASFRSCTPSGILRTFT